MSKYGNFYRRSLVTQTHPLPVWNIHPVWNKNAANDDTQITISCTVMCPDTAITDLSLCVITTAVTQSMQQRLTAVRRRWCVTRDSIMHNKQIPTRHRSVVSRTGRTEYQLRLMKASD